MFNFFKRKQKDPNKYKMLCRTCDIFFKVDDPKRERTCPVCGTADKVDTYSVINRETGEEYR